ncbi:MAG: Alkaline phosphatase [Acidimicrobiales bacterium]|nr:Alkaline phosphatase [Acidimicrobiales bacterium]
MALTPRRRFTAAALVGLLGAAGLAVNASATAAFRLSRVAGTDRYETASAIAGDAFAAGSQTAIIARGNDFADALAGAYLSGLQTSGAPVLLTATGAVPAATKSRLAAMGARNVILLGGTSAISTAAEQDLAKTYTVTRVAGTDRFDTAAKIAQTSSTLGVGTLGGAKTAIVASGEEFPDALAAGSVSFSQRFPILLTRAGSLPAESKAALTALAIKHVVLVGGTTPVSDAVDAEVKAAGATTERVAGTNRYATATAMATFALGKLPAWNATDVDLATGDDYADALAGGPAAGKTNRSVLLTATASLSPATATWLQAHTSTLTGGRVFGGTGAVTDATRSAAEQAGGAPSSAGGGQVTEVDTNNNRYTYVAKGASTATTVTYKATDVFTVDGNPADLGGFEANITPADTITYAAGTTARHDLVNVAASTITSGTIGDVNTSPTAQTFAFISTVTGSPLRSGVKYTGTGVVYTIDGGASTSDVATFEGEISEGDSITISGSTIALTNGTVSGAAQAIAKQAVRVQLRVGVFGDDPASSTNDLFSAEPGDSFTVTGTSAAGTTPTDFQTFSGHLTAGDTVTYRRTAGTELYTLLDQPLASQSGQAMDSVTKNGDALPANDTADGGSFALATTGGSVTVTYVSSGAFVVNGNVSDEATFESKYSAGDTISFRPGDTNSGTAQRLELTDANLAGAVKASTIDTSNNPPNANSYEVLAQNGATVLDRVTYAPATDAFTVNGATASAAAFETALNDIKAGTKTGSVVVTTSGANQVHNLTTVAAA